MIDLSEQIEKVLKEYGDKVKSKVNEAVDEQAEESVKDLKQTSPKRKGKYAKSWTKKENFNVIGNKSAVVHNKKHYRLTHLIENGHAKKGGGRTRAIPHIKPVEEKAVKNFEKKVRDKIESI